jgi:hypothetical protein
MSQPRIGCSEVASVSCVNVTTDVKSVATFTHDTEATFTLNLLEKPELASYSPEKTLVRGNV